MPVFDSTRLAGEYKHAAGTALRQWTLRDQFLGQFVAEIGPVHGGRILSLLKSSARHARPSSATRIMI